MKTQKQQGFTIIEVVLVLAIAGLIFLVVFLAVPALQKSQRDTARRNDIGRVVAAVQSHRTNAQGRLPTNWDDFKNEYLGADFADPQADTYSFVAGSDTSNPNTGQISYHLNRICSGTGVTRDGAGARNVAFRVKLESGGYYCASN